MKLIPIIRKGNELSTCDRNHLDWQIKNANAVYVGEHNYHDQNDILKRYPRLCNLIVERSCFSLREASQILRDYRFHKALNRQSYDASVVERVIAHRRR
jgi:hypothetical protein